MSEDKKSGAASREYKRHGSRYKARRRAADILFEAEARDIDPVAIVSDRIALSRDIDNAVAPVNPYTKAIVEGAAQELDRIDSLIGAHLSEDWELDRIPAVDRAILRVAVWELIFNEDVPVATAVVEAVELASQYSGDEAPSYIHAVLDSMAKNIEELRTDAPIEPIEDAEDAAGEAQDSDAGLDELVGPEDVEGAEGTAGASDAENAGDTADVTDAAE